jgi:MYXO-CTERM domain-containing protein
MDGPMANAHRAPLVCGVCSVLFAATATAASLEHSEPLRAYRALAQGAARKPSAGEPATLHFNAFSRDFVLEIEPNARLAAMQARLHLAPGTGAYRGTVADAPGSWARVVLTADGPAGLVYDGETLYGLEVPADGVGSSTGPTMFRLADVYFAPGELACEVGAAPLDGMRALAVLGEEFTAQSAAGATLNLDLGAVADFEFSEAFGANAETALLTRFNNVDGIFSEQLGVQITVAQVDVFTANDDPFTSSAASTLLNELAQYRGATPTQDAQGLTHMFTGRDLDGTTAGIAFLGSVCAHRSFGGSRSFGVGLSEGRRGATVDSLVAAHEIGHNFGAPHDGETGSACENTPTTFLMAPSVNGSNQFSTCSVIEMQQEIASASCLEPIGSVDVGVAMPAAAAAVTGVALTHTAVVTSLGSDVASNVAFTATAAAGLEILAADAGAASCTVTPLSATCALGTLSGGAARNVALTLRPLLAGAFALTATVGADQDSDSSNDTAASTIDSRSGVDLAVTGTATAVDLDQAVTVAATVTNGSDFAATNMVVTATLAAGLRPDQAVLDGISCVIAGQNFTCPVRTLAGHGAIGLAVTVTGLAAGTSQLTIGATASETDTAPGNNQASVAVTVRSLVADETDDGGGGGTSGWTLAALLLAFAARRFERRRRDDAPAPRLL